VRRDGDASQAYGRDRQATHPVAHHEVRFAHGVNDFILCLGCKGWRIKERFRNVSARSSDRTIHRTDNRITYRKSHGKLPTLTAYRQQGFWPSMAALYDRMLRGNLCLRALSQRWPTAIEWCAMSFGSTSIRSCMKSASATWRGRYAAL